MFLSEVLTEMKKLTPQKKPVPFSVEVRTYNRYNKSGGKLVKYNDAEYMNPPKNKGAVRLSDTTPFKNPQHFKNRTRNIKVDGDIKKINILFITRFNGRTVVY